MKATTAATPSGATRWRPPCRRASDACARNSAIFLFLCIFLTCAVGVQAGWHARREPDTACLNTGGLRCHAAGYPASKLQGLFNKYELLMDMESGTLAEPESTGRFSLGLHSRSPRSDPLLIRMLNDTGQQCTDPAYCTLQTWWENKLPRVHVTRDVARLFYPLTPLNGPFPVYDFVVNETVSLDQLYGDGGWWNSTVSQAFPGYTSVADLLDCDTPFVVHPTLRPVHDEITQAQCEALLADNTTFEFLPFTLTGMLPLDCARLPLPSYLYDDIASDIGAHPLRTSYDLSFQQEEIPGGLPGTLDNLRPGAQLTHLWQKYIALYGYMARAKVRHQARAYPPCSSGPNPDSLILSHQYKLGEECQLYRLPAGPQWLWRTNITLTFQADEVHPAMAQAVVVDGQETGEYEVQGSWWLVWDGQSVTVQPEGNFLQSPVGNILRHFIDMPLVRMVQLDDSKHRRLGPTLNGAVVVCGSHLNSAWGLAQNPWEQTPWLSKPDDEWFMPVPSPRFLRTGWTDAEWNSFQSAAELSPYRPGPFYWVPPEEILTQFGTDCGQVGATGPCPSGSSSLDNDWGPLHAFEQLDSFAQDQTIYDGMPDSMLTDHSAYLPPLDRAWTNDLQPQAWISSHTASNIPVGLLVEPTTDLLTELQAELHMHVSDRLANPRSFPRHRRSATNSTSQLPLRNFYQQVLNHTGSQCVLQWFNLSQAYTQNDGNLTQFLKLPFFPPPSDLAVGLLQARFCNPDAYRQLSPNGARARRQYIETWTCQSLDDQGEPPLTFRSSLGTGHSIFNASAWDSPLPCANGQPRVFYPNSLNFTRASEWWRRQALKVQENGWTRFDVLECTVQLTDPTASPQIGLFPTAPEGEVDPRLPERFRVRPLPDNTLRCQLHVGLPGDGLVSNQIRHAAAEASALLGEQPRMFITCNPFLQVCRDEMNAAMLEYLVWIICVGVAVLAAIISGLVVAVYKCRDMRELKRTKKYKSQ